MCYGSTGTLGNHSVQDRPVGKVNTMTQEHGEIAIENSHDLFHLNFHIVTGNETEWKYH